MSEPIQESEEFPPETARMLSWRALSIVNSPIQSWFKPALGVIVLLIGLAAFALHFVSVPSRAKFQGVVRVDNQSAYIEFSLPDLLAKDVRIGDVVEAHLDLMSEPVQFQVSVARFSGRDSEQNLRVVVVPIMPEIAKRWSNDKDRFNGALSEVSLVGPKQSLLNLLIQN